MEGLGKLESSRDRGGIIGRHGNTRWDLDVTGSLLLGHPEKKQEEVQTEEGCCHLRLTSLPPS